MGANGGVPAAIDINVAGVRFADLVASNGAIIEFRLTVTDIKGASDSDTTTFNVMTNDTPTADISLSATLPGPDAPARDADGNGTVTAAEDAAFAAAFTVDAVIDGPGENGNADNEWDIREGALLTLDGSGSSDPDGDDLNYSWTLVYESGSVTGVGFPTDETGASSASTLPATGATTNKISTNGGATDGTKTIGRLNVSRAQGAISQSPYNVIYTLAVTDAGVAVAADGSNIDSTALVRIVVHDEPADPTVTAKIEDETRLTANIIEGAAVAGGTVNVLVPPGSGRYQVIPDSDDTTDLTVTLTATAYDADADTDGDGTHVERAQATGLLSGNDGSEVAPGVKWSSDDLPDTAIATANDSTASNAKTATVTIPATAEAGDTFTITATVNRSEVSTSITLVIADSNNLPVATILTPKDATTSVTDPTVVTPTNGVYTITGFGFDPDGGSTTSVWTQLINNAAAEASDDGYVELTGAFSNTVSFNKPTDPTHTTVTLAYTVIDDTGAFGVDIINVAISPDAGAPTALSAGGDQVVAPESTVILTGSASGLPTGVTISTWAWSISGLSTSPDPGMLTKAQSDAVHKSLLAFYDDANDNMILDLDDPTTTGTDESESYSDSDTSDSQTNGDGWPLRAVGNQDQYQHFPAPKLASGLDYAQIEFTLTATASANVVDTTGDGSPDSPTLTAKVTITVADSYFSSYIDNPGYCEDRSLGGPQTYPHDSNGDGVADVCSLKSTRRVAVARQNALQQLASLGLTIDVTDNNSSAGGGAIDRTSGATLTDLVLGRAGNDGTGASDDVSTVVGTCAMAKRLAPAPDDPDACDTGRTALTPPPDPPDPADAAMFYSGVISGPEFCTNHSLGGARQYAHDLDGDGVADICSLHTTRREAIAVQLALVKFEAHSQFPTALAAACTALGSETFGESAAALRADACSVGTMPQRPGSGNALPS
ncbi:MAG: hypothetical protein OXH23_16315 [bacterium]|nr:hypothetical protein [bacterium]